MPVSRFRKAPVPLGAANYIPIKEETLTGTGTSDATAQNLTKSISLAGCSTVLLFIEVTAKANGGSDVTKISVKYRVSSKEAPVETSDTGWAWIRADNLTASTGVSATQPYTAEIADVSTQFDAGTKLHVLSFPAHGTHGSARIWTDNACDLKTSWMRTE